MLFLLIRFRFGQDGPFIKNVIKIGVVLFVIFCQRTNKQWDMGSIISSNFINKGNKSCPLIMFSGFMSGLISKTNQREIKLQIIQFWKPFWMIIFVACKCTNIITPNSFIPTPISKKKKQLAFLRNTFDFLHWHFLACSVLRFGSCLRGSLNYSLSRGP